MENRQIIKILSKPEGPDLEFKERPPEPELMAKILSAFSNSDGGTVVLGVGSHGTVIGVRNLDEAMNKISRALDLIKPRPEVNSSIEMVDGKAVVVLDVQRSDRGPHSVKNMLFQRVGAAVLPVDAHSLYRRIIQDTDTLETIHSKIIRLTEITADQNKQLIYAQTWRAKIVDMIIGGVIGALISLLIQLVL